MVIDGITVAYGNCTYCKRSSSIVAYNPRTARNLFELEHLIHKKCTFCKHPLSIKKVKMKAKVHTRSTR